MKALSLWQPWASLVVVGLKRIETRSWSTHYRGPLVIHAAQKWTCAEQTALEGFYAYPEVRAALYGEMWPGIDRWTLVRQTKLPLGAALAVVDLLTIVPTDNLDDSWKHFRARAGVW